MDTQTKQTNNLNTNSQINCANPRVIINPKLPELIAKYGCYVQNRRIHYMHRKPHHITQFEMYKFSPRLRGITIDNYTEDYVLDSSTGETFPIYLAVPCGHCDLCKSTSINSFVYRCRLESQCYNNQPWFITLTYAPFFKPPSGVQVRDVQLFLKRFRINLVRSGFTNRIRYCAVGEYGKDTHRPHYHLIVWNLCSYTTEDYKKIQSIIGKSWKLGYNYSRLADPRNDKSFKYTAKYLRKEDKTPVGQNPTFLLSSRGNGGIGSPFIDKHAKQIRKTLDINYKFRNIWTGKVEEMKWTSYVINRIFPSFCSSVDSGFRSSVYYSTLYLDCLSRYETKSPLRTYFKKVYDYLEPHFYIPLNFHSVKSCSPIPSENGSRTLSFQAYDVLNYALKDCKRVIDKFITKYDFKLCKRLNVLRSMFLGKLFEYARKFNIPERLYDVQWMLQYDSPRTNYV